MEITAIPFSRLERVQGAQIYHIMTKRMRLLTSTSKMLSCDIFKKDHTFTSSVIFQSALPTGTDDATPTDPNGKQQQCTATAECGLGSVLAGPSSHAPQQRRTYLRSGHPPKGASTAPRNPRKGPTSTAAYAVSYTISFGHAATPATTAGGRSTTTVATTTSTTATTK